MSIFVVACTSMIISCICIQNSRATIKKIDVIECVKLVPSWVVLQVSVIACSFHNSFQEMESLPTSYLTFVVGCIREWHYISTYSVSVIIWHNEKIYFLTKISWLCVWKRYYIKNVCFSNSVFENNIKHRYNLCTQHYHSTI